MGADLRQPVSDGAGMTETLLATRLEPNETKMPRLRDLPLTCLVLASLSSCGPSMADVAAGTVHCGTTQLEPGLLMRISTYHPRGTGLARRHWLVQACQPHGNCLPIVTYWDAMGPVYAIDRQGTVVVEADGGNRRERSSTRDKLRGPTAAGGRPTGFRADGGRRQPLSRPHGPSSRKVLPRPLRARSRDTPELRGTMIGVAE